MRILRWIRTPGDKGQNGEALLDVAADKVNVEIEAPADGELLDVSAKEADCIQFGAVLAVIDKPLEPVGRRRNYSSLELKHVGRSRWGSVPCPNGNHTCKADFDPIF